VLRCGISGRLCIVLRLQVLLLKIGGIRVALRLKTQAFLFGGIELVSEVAFALLLRPVVLLLIPLLALQFQLEFAAAPAFALQTLAFSLFVALFIGWSRGRRRRCLRRRHWARTRFRRWLWSRSGCWFRRWLRFGPWSWFWSWFGPLSWTTSFFRCWLWLRHWLRSRGWTGRAVVAIRVIVIMAIVVIAVAVVVAVARAVVCVLTCSAKKARRLVVVIVFMACFGAISNRQNAHQQSAAQKAATRNEPE